MKIRFYISIGVLFILAGLLLFSDYVIKFAGDVKIQPVLLPIVEIKPEIVNKTVDVALPDHINIPDVGISVDIEPGYYDYSNNTWTQSNEKANFAIMTSAPNMQSGNTYIYGHNRPNIFARLNDLDLGDKAVVRNSEEKLFSYRLIDIKDVQPTDLTLLNYSGKPILTLQTCSGLWGQYRRLFVFDLESESY